MKNKVLTLLLLASLPFFSTSTFVLQGAENTDILYIDRMDKIRTNELDGRNAGYSQPPSRVTFFKSNKWSTLPDNKALKIMYDKRNEGGVRDDGGFCGYYTILKSHRKGYLNAGDYGYLTFWVRGDGGSEESFKVGLADRYWEIMEDSVKSEPIEEYLPEGQITPEWQLAVIDLDDFFLDHEELFSLAICFEADVFDDGSNRGAIFIDDIAFVKTEAAVNTLRSVRGGVAATLNQ